MQHIQYISNIIFIVCTYVIKWYTLHPQKSLLESNAQASNITQIHLPKNRHMISGLLEALKSINKITYHANLVINNLNHARNFSITSTEMDHRLNQLQNDLRKLEYDSLINYITM